MLIIPLPKGATHADTYLARMLQSLRELAHPDSMLTVMFIPYDAHQLLIKQFYKVDNNMVIPTPDPVNLTAKLSEGTLLYAWGSASFGKLGNGVSRTA